MSTTADEFGFGGHPAFQIPNFEQLKRAFESHTENQAANMETANIVVAGNAGVGKSTLINAMFGSEFAKTGIGRPITQNVEKIAVPGKPIALYDTRGLEIKSSAETISALSGLVKNLRSQSDHKDQIHCFWMCLGADALRTEDAHRELYNLCVSYRIPFVVVVTKDYLGSDEFLEHIWKEFPESQDVVSVVAQERSSPRGNIPAFGLDKLLDATLKAMPDAIKASVEFAQVAVMARKVDAARNVVNWSSGVGVATAFPLAVVPGGHMAVLVPLQVNMIVQINKALGIDMTEADSKALVSGLVGVIAAAVGGKMLFVEGIKFIPGLGTVAAMVIGASVAGVIVKALGEIYINFMVSEVGKGGKIEVKDVLDGLKDAIKLHSDKFKS